MFIVVLRCELCICTAACLHILPEPKIDGKQVRNGSQDPKTTFDSENYDFP